MPVDLLLEAAVNLLRQRGENVVPSSIVLMHENHIMDPSVDRLSDHGIVAEDVVIIDIPEEPHLERRSQDGKFDKGRQSDYGKSSFTYEKLRSK